MIAGLLGPVCTLRSQDQACAKLRTQGSHLARSSAYLEAYTYYRDAADCFLRRGDYVAKTEASLHALDCLVKGFEYKQYYRESAELIAFITQHAEEIPGRAYDQFESAIECFEVVTELNSGNTERTFILLDTLIRKYQRLIQAGRNPVFYNQRLVQCFNWRAEAYEMEGDYNQAIADSREALQRMEPYRATYVGDGGMIGPHLAIARCYAALGEPPRVITHYDSVRQLIPRLTQKHRDRAFSAFATIFDYYLTHDTDSARIYLARIRALRSPEHAYETWQMAGDLQYQTGELQPALASYRHALDIIAQRQGLKSEAEARVRLALGLTLFDLEEYEGALDHLHRGLLSVSNAYEDPDPFSAPPRNALYRQRDLLQTLLYKSMSLHALYTRDSMPEHLIAAWRNIYAGVQLLNQLRTGYVTGEDRQLIIEQGYPVFEEAIGIASVMNVISTDGSWVDTAFVLMEQSKALNLLDAVLHERAKQYAGIPDSLVALEAALKQEVTERAAALREMRRQTAGTGYVRNAEDALRAAEIRYQQLVRTFEAQHPRYFRLKHQQETIRLGDIQRRLLPDQALIEYFVGDHHVYAVHVRPTSSRLLYLGKRDDLSAHTVGLRDALSAYLIHQDGLSTERYGTHALALFRMLLAPVDTVSRSLIIVPDGNLGLISFAGLLSAPLSPRQDLRTARYVLWDQDIAYCYSANLLEEFAQVGRDAPVRGLACAPVFEDQPALDYHLDEARFVRRITRGVLLAEEACTASALHQALAPGHPFGIVHFATHGSANARDGDESFIAFAGSGDDARLYARDLYNMHLDAELIYLSACETGAGELQRGEGIISFARGFFYAGARSLVTALWKIRDRSAMVLTRSFYENLQTGQTKDAAIAEAQRTYLRSLDSESRRWAHPAYWSGLVLYGSNAPVSLPPGPPLLLWLGLAAGAVMLVFIFLKKKRHPRSHSNAGIH